SELPDSNVAALSKSCSYRWPALGELELFPPPQGLVDSVQDIDLEGVIGCVPEEIGKTLGHRRPRSGLIGRRLETREGSAPRKILAHEGDLAAGRELHGALAVRRDQRLYPVPDHQGQRPVAGILGVGNETLRDRPSVLET